MTNPFAFKRLLLAEANNGMLIPLGYQMNCGFPVFYGMMYNILHGSFYTPARRSDDPFRPMI